MKYRVLIERDEDGAFVAEVPSLPGCLSQRSTRDEALAGIGEAIALYVESLEAHGEPVPPPITEEIVEFSVVRAARRLGPRDCQGARQGGLRDRSATRQPHHTPTILIASSQNRRA